MLYNNFLCFSSFFILKSILSEDSYSSFLWFPFAWNRVFNPFPFYKAEVNLLKQNNIRYYFFDPFSFSMYFCISFDHCFHITWLIISIFYRTVWILGPWFETYSKEKGSWPAEGIVVDTSAFAPLAVHPGLAVVGSSHSPSAAGVLPLDSRHLSAPYCARAFSQCQGTFWAGL